MTTIYSLDGFVELIRKNRLVESARLDECLVRLRAEGKAADQGQTLAEALVRNALLSPLQARALLSGKPTGYYIGKYKILDFLGAGGTGKVYLCEHPHLKRAVAVKVLQVASAQDATIIERFYREARATTSLYHPNILRIFDVDSISKVPFMVMEYVDGHSLHHIVAAHGAMSWERAVHYIAQTAAGLQHAHEAGWVHRDIKPGNILLSRSGLVKVLDMGLARLFADKGESLTKEFDDGSVLGTADYIAPEQAINSSDVDIRADIYSLGATFYYLLAGTPPFGSGTVAQKLLWHQMRSPDPISALRKDIPAEAQGLLERMMAKHPAHRFQKPLEVMAALQPWMQHSLPVPPEAEMPRHIFMLARMGLAELGSAPPPSTSSWSSILAGGSGSVSSLSLTNTPSPSMSGVNTPRSLTALPPTRVMTPPRSETSAAAPAATGSSHRGRGSLGQDATGDVVTAAGP